MVKDYISRYSKADQEGLFVLGEDISLGEGEILNFLELAELKEQVDNLFSEEQSRLITAELAGDLTCDGCTI